MRYINRKKLMQTLAVLILSLALIFTGCSSGTVEEKSSEVVPTVTDSIDTSQMFSSRDLEVGYDEASATKISLSEKTTTITDEGTYILSGTLSDGMVIVDASDSAKIQLVLDGVTITSKTSAAIYVKNADKVFITLAADSVNRLANGGTYTAIDDNNIDSVIFSKADLTLNGMGTLTIEGSDAGHGIVSKDDLVITCGTYEISSASHALSANDSVRIADGDFTLTSGKDGIHAENTDDTSLGFVYIANGTFNINASGDGVDAGNYLLIDNGTVEINAGGGTSGTTSADISTKGLKATGSLYIKDGTIIINSSDDSIHSNENIFISDGDLTLSSGDDGIHADSILSISGSKILISESYEGLEGLNIQLSGGDINLTASDDGINAAGGADQSGFGGRGGDMMKDKFNTQNDTKNTTQNTTQTTAAEASEPVETTELSESSITISGGTIYINAGGDGVDSNGSLYVTGGNTFVEGPEDGGNGALDYTTAGTITGGTFVAIGSSQMAMNFDSSSSQGSMLTTVDNADAVGSLVLTADDGSQLISYNTSKKYSSVLISCPDLKEGGTYTLSAGGQTLTITMDTLIYGSGSGFGGGMGGGHGFNGNDPHTDQGERPQRPEQNQKPNQEVIAS